MAAGDVVTNTGKGLITGSMIAAVYKYIGWGTSSAATAAATDTALATAAAEARTSGTQTQQTTTTTNDTYQVVGTIVSTSAQTIWEVGIFDASSAGNMFSHHTFAAGVGLANGDSVAFTLKYKLS